MLSQSASPDGPSGGVYVRGLLDAPHVSALVPIGRLSAHAKWTQFPLGNGDVYCGEAAVPSISDFFYVRRGVATGDNKFFILSREDIERLRLPMGCFQPILPSHRYLPEDEIQANPDGSPMLKKSLFLLNCNLPEENILSRYPQLADYLAKGKENGVPNGYLCRHRSPWYSQERREVTPFICTYIGRGDARNGRPFRFILNHSDAIAANVYLLLYPKGLLSRLLARKPDMKYDVWRILRELSPASMIQQGRVYGGGLHKMEPSELGNVPAASLAELVAAESVSLIGGDIEPWNSYAAAGSRQMTLF